MCGFYLTEWPPHWTASWQRASWILVYCAVQRGKEGLGFKVSLLCYLQICVIIPGITRQSEAINISCLSHAWVAASLCSVEFVLSGTSQELGSLKRLNKLLLDKQMSSSSSSSCSQHARASFCTQCSNMEHTWLQHKRSKTFSNRFKALVYRTTPNLYTLLMYRRMTDLRGNTME